EDIGDYEYFLVCQNLVCGSRGSSIGAFGQNPALYAVGVTAGDLVLGGSRNQNFAVGDKQLSRVNRLCAGKIPQRSMPLAIIPKSFHIDSIPVVKTAFDFENADDFVACFRHQACRV